MTEELEQALAALEAELAGWADRLEHPAWAIARDALGDAGPDARALARVRAALDLPRETPEP